MRTNTQPPSATSDYIKDITVYVQEPQVIVLKVVEALSGQIQPLSTRDVAELTGISLSQARGALASLTSAGWVQASMGSERLFLLSPQVAALALNQYAAVQTAVNGHLAHLQHLSTALNTVTHLLR